MSAAEVTNLEVRDAMRNIINAHGRIDSVNLRTLLVEFSWDMRQRRFKRGVNLDNFVNALQIVRDMDEEPALPDDYRSEVVHPKRGSGHNNMANSGDNLLDIPEVQNPWPDEQKIHEEVNAGPPQPWNCPTCTFVNKPDFLICDMCGVVKPSPAELAAAAASSQGQGDDRQDAAAAGSGDAVVAMSPVSAAGSSDEPMPAESPDSPRVFTRDEVDPPTVISEWLPSAEDKPSKMVREFCVGTFGLQLAALMRSVVFGLNVCAIFVFVTFILLCRPCFLVLMIKFSTNGTTALPRV